MDGTLGDVRSHLSPSTILLIVLALQLLDVLFEKLKKRGSTSSEEIKLRQEINQLLKEANSLSTPSTFAQAAKLRRVAIAKEKELKKKREENNNDKKWSLYEKVLLASKALLYTGLCWQFWSTPVAAVPPHILQPFGRLLAWRGTDASNGYYMVGIIPWLVLTSRVSKFLLQKLFKFISF
ncbi:tail-anchored protein insertion receptor WRB [Phalaenopsis equestris]|uniref:tail-anchored protein insertion receptor WRB n=1 Tax=Phalaenopsis equestris TaxID=78828 RepID=UPI0009E4F78D|nr:tail-anchored protein insertion receptor WRB [Phalaenopsis equestris]